MQRLPEYNSRDRNCVAATHKLQTAKRVVQARHQYTLQNQDGRPLENIVQSIFNIERLRMGSKISHPHLQLRQAKSGNIALPVHAGVSDP